ncbi:MAG TPA: DUF1573 domain-containing protein [Flavisolibacter sp.]|jgi:hypothetical protein|nr:DUF1573 domain-containing protein [Flavisolibacter sp.]
MKRTLLLSVGFFVFSVLKAQTLTQVAQPVQNLAYDALELKESEHDFGKIPQGKPVFYYFEIVNKTTVPLKLDNVQASCGCTTPEWNKEAIPAGSTDKIKVGYNAANEGTFDKFITVTYNTNQTKQIKIKGYVWKAPTGSAPANASVQFLKQQIQ